MNIIEIRNLNKRIGDKIIFENANLKIQKNSLNFLIGPSGSGKTTLFNILAGIDQDYIGEVLVNGKINLNIFVDNKYLSEDLTIIFQNYALVENWTVNKNLEIVGKPINKDIINKLRIDDLLNIKVCELSGGEQQRVAIARSLLLDTEIILCDEPTGNLDYDSEVVVMDIFKDLVKQYDKTILIITHSRNYLDERTFEISNKKIIIKD